MPAPSPDQPGQPNQPGQSNQQDPLHPQDSLWNALGNASKQELSPFFARNVLRATRALKPTWKDRLARFFTPKRTIASIAATATAACIALLLLAQSEAPQPAPVTADTPENGGNAETPSTALAELVIEESLAAAAEDPSQFTHDELLTIVGL